MSVGYRFSHLSTVRDCRGMRICIPSVSEGRDENIHQKTRSRDGLNIESKEIFVSLKFIKKNIIVKIEHLAKTYAENVYFSTIKE